MNNKSIKQRLEDKGYFLGEERLRRKRQILDSKGNTVGYYTSLESIKELL